MMDNAPILGTTLKFNLNIPKEGQYTMDDYDFYIEIHNRTNNIIIKKSEMERIDSDNYVFVVETKDLGIGEVKARVYRELPDSSIDDLFRTEITDTYTNETYNIKIKN